MSSQLTYVPCVPPARPFAVGDVVEIINRNGTVIGEERIVATGSRGVRTKGGRQWDLSGQWSDGSRSWPFPSIRLKAQESGAPHRDHHG